MAAKKDEKKAGEPKPRARKPKAERTGAGAETGTGTGADAASNDALRRRHTEVGTVVSDKMTKTVVVAVQRLVQHPMYHKTIRRTSRFMAHDEKGAKRGDTVRIVETRPLSASKRWRVEEIIARAGAAAEETVAPAGA